SSVSPKFCTPPHSTLFPYTTLFRSVVLSALRRLEVAAAVVAGPTDRDGRRRERRRVAARRVVRAERLERDRPTGIRGHAAERRGDRKSTRLNSITWPSRMPSSA